MEEYNKESSRDVAADRFPPPTPKPAAIWRSFLRDLLRKTSVTEQPEEKKLPSRHTIHHYPRGNHHATTQEIEQRRRSGTDIPILIGTVTSEDSTNDQPSSPLDMSEVTLRTYSDEKADMIQQEYYMRMKLQTRKLSMEEKRSLVSEIEREQEPKFRRLSNRDYEEETEQENGIIEVNNWVSKSKTINSTKDGHDAYINEIIELKLLVANQQATIDTLSSNLNNLPLSNGRQSRVQDLVIENAKFAAQIMGHQERELRLRNELNSLRKNEQHSMNNLVMDGEHHSHSDEMVVIHSDLTGEHLDLLHQ